MNLLERENQLAALNQAYHRVEAGEGYAVFITGEAGIGKTSLVNKFLHEKKDNASVYVGLCDSLFSPRPLGPLYDIAAEISYELFEMLRDEKDRALIFSTLLHQISKNTRPVIVVIEDIHWADESTLDLIKFVVRRITRMRCLFLLTYRDNEINDTHPLRTVFGELPPHTFSRIRVEPLSLHAVEKLAEGSRFSARDVYSISHGNAFYVSEILAWYSDGVPEKIKDSVLSVFNRQLPKVKAVWELISVFHTKSERWLLEAIEPDCWPILDVCIQNGIVKCDDTYVYFKHDLYGRAIESSLTASKTRQLNKQILEKMLEAKHAHKVVLSRLVHHAIQAESAETVAEVAPGAAREAAVLGAHFEASKLFKAALDYANKPKAELTELYEAYAYECYLTNQLKEAIDAEQTVLTLTKKKGDLLKEGNTLRFLSRLQWFLGNWNGAEDLARQAIETLENGMPSRERAFAYSNMAQLKMLDFTLDECLLWSQKAVTLATALNDLEVLCHVYNNQGTAKMLTRSVSDDGYRDLKKSLTISLENGYQEHVARAYTNLGWSYLIMNQFQQAGEALREGIKYTEERDLDSWTYYMQSMQAMLFLKTNNWQNAEAISTSLLNHRDLPNFVIINALLARAVLKIRKGEKENAESLLIETMEKAKGTQEIARLCPIATVWLEWEWVYGKNKTIEPFLDYVLPLVEKKEAPWSYSELVYWMKLCGYTLRVNTSKLEEPYASAIKGGWARAAQGWKALGSDYYYALACFGGTDEASMLDAVSVLMNLGATETAKRAGKKMRKAGIKNIPKGPRQSTRGNIAQLTSRQIEVLELLKKGMHNNEIADKLFISPKTVDHHISAILAKLDVNSRNKAVTEAQKLGILK